MTRNRANFLSYLFILAAVGVAAWLYPSIPEQVPSHWNVHGEVDGYMQKPWGVVILPLTAILVFLVMRLIPVISPKGYRTEPFANVMHIFQVAMVGFMSLVAILVLLEASGVDVHLNKVIFGALGLLFVVIGNYLGKVRKNFFLGIRTPWTLASDEVWARTHRIGGRLFVLYGLIMFAGMFVTILPMVFLVMVGVIVLVPVVYSYVVYRKVEGFTEER
ncbi:MAG TPA: SdpI family protein [Woeseiaceae bacterium]|nr:SdpI family protein [Woeseiaceae bacterium]